MLKNVLCPIHGDGWKFVAIAAFITVVLFALWWPLGWIGVVGTLWCLFFFRNPRRVTPTRAGLVVSPADGLVVQVGQATPPHDLEMGDAPMMRIAIFLNLFDVHINRIPIEGIVVDTRYRSGKFVNASLDKASEENERMAIRLRSVEGPEVAVIQIAGLVARRIVTNLNPGQVVATGERFGLIRFGSRTELYLPTAWSVQVIEGQHVIGGETVLADALATEPRRVGVAR